MQFKNALVMYFVTMTAMHRWGERPRKRFDGVSHEKFGYARPNETVFRFETNAMVR
jgi:hypothetical protein